ncbi:hypothetical protein WMY93_011715 [Mugilogobius chulae]|uniref:C2 domain-containing protein n=1 Tax=Mugilogobius chulae TaxID=88201 RepID=A0AAW0PC93_9GOBI
MLYLVFGRTEVIDNTLNPDFVRKYIMDYFFEEKQNLRFDLAHIKQVSDFSISVHKVQRDDASSQLLQRQREKGPEVELTGGTEGWGPTDKH